MTHPTPNQELKACPFCGSFEITHENADGQHSIGCRNEDCFGNQSLTTFARQADAVKAWNTRHHDDSTRMKLERVELLESAVCFFCSVIKAGEPWTDYCQRRVAQLFPNLTKPERKENE